MGCGSSNTLESSDFCSMENMNRTKFNKTFENEKILQEKTEHKLSDACASCENEDDIDTLLKEMNEEYKSIQSIMSMEEQKDACLYRIAKTRVSREVMEKFEGSGDLFKNIISNTNNSIQDAATKIFLENIGKSVDVIFINFESSYYILNTAIKMITYDPEFLKYDTFVIIFPEKAIGNIETMKYLGSFIKIHAKLKNLLIGISDEGSKNEANFDNISYVFEGAALSRTLKNFGVLRLLIDEFSLKPESILKIEKAISIMKVSSLGLGNFNFNQIDKDKIIGSIAKNPQITLVGIQLIGVNNSNMVGEIVNYFSRSQTLRGLVVGANVSDPENVINIHEKTLKGNPKFEAFAVDLFKK